MPPLDLTDHPALQEPPAPNPESPEVQALKAEIMAFIHDVNTPLCVIEMSLSKLEQIAARSSDVELNTSLPELTASLERVNQLILKLQSLL